METVVFYLLMLQNYINSKQKSPEIRDYALCLGNVSKDFIINIMKKAGLNGVGNLCSVDFNPIDAKDFSDIHKYLIKITWYIIMLELIKKIFIGLLTCLVSGSNHAK